MYSIALYHQFYTTDYDSLFYSRLYISFLYISSLYMFSITRKIVHVPYPSQLYTRPNVQSKNRSRQSKPKYHMTVAILS